MPRTARKDFPGALQHVTNRGHEKKTIFRDAEDYDFFIRRIAQYASETRHTVLAFALMPNHFHLLTATGDVPLAAFMSKLETSYAVVHNARWRLVGHLYQNRYKNRICSSDADVRGVIRYIHRNPVRAGLAPTLDYWEWTSHRELLRGGAGIIDRSRALEFFSGDAEQYRAFAFQPGPEEFTLEQLASSFGPSAIERLKDRRRLPSDVSFRRKFIQAAVEAGYDYVQIGGFIGRAPTSVSRLLAA